ncbi:MAG: hypothetical protein AAF684_06220 [Pseudomonadota bacterium]
MADVFEGLWRSAAGESAFPPYAALRIPRSVYGANAVVLEVVGSGEDFVYRFVGDVVARHSTLDMTGVAMSALPGRGPGSLVFANALRVYESGRLSRQSITFIGVGSPGIETRQILAPCGPTGGPPSHLVGVIDYMRRRTPPHRLATWRAGEPAIRTQIMELRPPERRPH